MKSQGYKSIIEIVPLILFFVVNFKFGIMPATAVLMISTLIAVILSYKLYGKVPIVALIGSGFVLLFGGLTLIYDNDVFIKLKPTLLNAFFGGVILFCHSRNKNVIKYVLGESVKLYEEGWRRLSLRWGVFFLSMAVLNEFIWRNFSTDFWASFKLFGYLPLTFIFTAMQIPLILKYRLEEN